MVTIILFQFHWLTVAQPLATSVAEHNLACSIPSKKQHLKLEPSSNGTRPEARNSFPVQPGRNSLAPEPGFSYVLQQTAVEGFRVFGF